MKYRLIFLIFFGLIISVNAQITHPGKITTWSGEVLEGEIAALPGKTFFQGIQFTSNSGAMREYQPGDIQGFFVNEDYAFPANYESIEVDTLGTHFFQVKFEDGRLKYLQTVLPAAEDEEPGVIEIYEIDNQPVLVDYTYPSLPYRVPELNQPVRGGIITAKGDTLRGTYTLQRNKVTLEAGRSTTFNLKDIQGVFNDRATYYVVDIVTVSADGRNQTSSKELCWVAVDGPVIQLLARQVDLTTEQQGFQTYYDNWGRLRRYPTSRRVRTGSTSMFTLRNHETNQVLNFLPNPFQPPTRLGGLPQLREWLAGYPALQSAALGNVINSEKALVHLYNLHLDLKYSDGK